MNTLVRWNPWTDLFALHNQMDRLVNGPTADRGAAEYTSLPIDIRQTDGAYTVEASVPGFAPDQVEVTVENGVLTIRGRLDESADQTDGTFLRRERRVSSMYRRVAIPDDVDTDGVAATFANGVLRVELPRNEKQQPRRIEVRHAETPPAAKVIDAPQS